MKSLHLLGKLQLIICCINKMEKKIDNSDAWSMKRYCFLLAVRYPVTTVFQNGDLGNLTIIKRYSCAIQSDQKMTSR